MTGTGGGLIRPTTEAQMKRKPVKNWIAPAARTSQGPVREVHLDLEGEPGRAERWV